MDMMLEAGSSTGVRNKARLTPLQLVDPRNRALRDLIAKHEYANLNRGDFVSENEDQNQNGAGAQLFDNNEAIDDTAEFSGSDEDERIEWERRRKAKK